MMIVAARIVEVDLRFKIRTDNKYALKTRQDSNSDPPERLPDRISALQVPIRSQIPSMYAFPTFRKQTQ
jgi:hypothetical protein